MLASATMTQERQQAAMAVDVVPVLIRAKNFRMAMQESSLRLRVCASSESLRREEETFESCRKSAASEIMKSRQILLQSSTDSPSFCDAARHAINREAMLLWETEREMSDEKNKIMSFAESEATEEESEARMAVDQEDADELELLFQDVEELEMVFENERKKELVYIEGEVSALAETMHDMSLLLSASAAPLDSLESNIESSKKKSGETVELLEEAERHETDRRKRKLKMVLFGVAVVLTLGVGLAVYKLVKK